MDAPGVQAKSLTEVSHIPRHYASMHDADHAIGNAHDIIGSLESTGQDYMYTCVSGDLTA